MLTAVQQQMNSGAAGQSAAPIAAQAPPAGNRILFLVVVSGADLDCLEEPRPSGPRYTRDSLRSLLQLLGCKPRVAYKIMLGVFQAVDQAVINARQNRISRKTFQVHPHRNGKLYVSLTRTDFMQLVSTSAAQYSYKISPSSDELKVACSLRERRRCVVVLLCGTSGSGKSTLASILAGRLGITTVISTDSIRHMLRSFSNREASPLLWASTYQAGEYVSGDKGGEGHAGDTERTLCGYKAQCELLAEQLEQLVAGCEARQQSLICEGVHLNISCVLKLMSRHPDVLPFLVHIASEDKHVERMAVRAKYMTLDPNKNRYVRYMGNIRLIQEYLVRKADKHAIPRVENTNVDRSVGIIHLTVMGCMRRMAKGESVLDHATGSTRMLAAEYAAVLEHLEGEKERAAAAAAAAAAARASSSLSDTLGAGTAASAGAAASSSRLADGAMSVAVPATAAASDPSCSNATSSSSSKAAQQQQQQQQQQQHAAVPETLGGLSGDITGMSAVAVISNKTAAAAVAVPLVATSTATGAACSSAASSRRSSLDAQHRRRKSIDTQLLLLQQQQQQQEQHDCGDAQQLSCMSAAPAARPVATQVAQQSAAACSGSTTGGIAAALAGGVAVCRAASPAPADADELLVMSPEGPVMRWDKLLQGSGLSPVEDSIAHSPVSPLAADGLAVAYPQQRQGSSLNPLAAHSGSSSGVGAASAAAGETAAESDGGEVVYGSGDNGVGQGSRRSSSGEQQQQEQELEFSSGEELDELGELGSSDNEHERYMLQDYGSMNESTTCDEHDEDDQELLGLRAWNAGMTRALWPSYHHVYAHPGTFNTGGGSTTLPGRSPQSSQTFAETCSTTSSSGGLPADRSRMQPQPNVAQGVVNSSPGASPNQQQQQQQQHSVHAARAQSAGSTRQQQGHNSLSVDSAPMPPVSRPWSGGSSSRQHPRAVHTTLRRSGSSGRLGSRRRWSGGGLPVSPVSPTSPQQLQQRQLQPPQ